MHELNWAVIGAGRFGRIHAKCLAGLPGVRLAGLCTRSEETRRALQSEFGVPTTVDYQQLLADPQVDVVTVATHWQQHHALALAALKAGKHLLLEKPMAASGRECLELLAASRRARSLAMVGHICRFDPRAALARQAILNGRIGRPVSLHAKRNLPTAPGQLRLDKISPLMGDGIHDVDLMMWMLGQPPRRVYARQVRVRPFRYPDLAWAMLEFGPPVDDGPQAIGVIETNWGLPENVSTVIDARLEVVGTEGTLVVDCAQTGLLVHDVQGPKYVDTDYWPELEGRIVGVLRDELHYFAECVRAGKQPSVVTLAEAARAVLVMETAERSAELGEPLGYSDPPELA